MNNLVLIIERKQGIGKFRPDPASPCFAPDEGETMEQMNQKAYDVARSWAARYPEDQFQVAIYERRETA